MPRAQTRRPRAHLEKVAQILAHPRLLHRNRHPVEPARTGRLPLRLARFLRTLPFLQFEIIESVQPEAVSVQRRPRLLELPLALLALRLGRRPALPVRGRRGPTVPRAIGHGARGCNPRRERAGVVVVVCEKGGFWLVWSARWAIRLSLIFPKARARGDAPSSLSSILCSTASRGIRRAEAIVPASCTRWPGITSC